MSSAVRISTDIMLVVICFLLLTSVRRKENIVPAIFLIGLTQIGEYFPVLATIRIELLAGLCGLIMIVLAGENLSQKLSDKKSKINRYFYLFILVVFLSVPFSVSISESLYWTEYYWKRCFILFFFVVAFLDTQEKLEKFVIFYLLGIMWLGFGGVISYFERTNIVIVGGVERVRGLTGLLSNPNGLANTIVAAIPLMYYLLIGWRGKRLKQIFLLITGGFSFAAVFMTGSRGGFIGLVASVFFIALFSKRKLRTTVLSCCVVIASLALAGPRLIQRYSTILALGSSDISAHSRLDGLIHGFSMLMKRPLFGVGIGCYPVARGRWFGWHLWAHNHYGQLIGELGMIGTIIWSLLIYHTVIECRRTRELITTKDIFERFKFIYYLLIGIEISIYTRLVLGMTTHSLHIFFWYLSAALIVASKLIVERDVRKKLQIAVNENHTGSSRGWLGLHD